jgi:hypothetical protein
MPHQGSMPGKIPRRRKYRESRSPASRNQADSHSQSLRQNDARDQRRTQSVLYRIVGWPALLHVAVDRAARLLEEVVGVPRWPKFKDKAAQHSRVRRSCLVNLMFRRADLNRLNWQHLRALPRCVATYIPPILNRLSLVSRPSNQRATSNRLIVS